MSTNPYFSQGTKNEQHLYEDIVVESLRTFGQDCYYIPREIVNRDGIFQDDSVSRFDNAYRIEMYIENIEGFDGEGDLFTKFGVEIRDAATFVVARRRWGNTVALYENELTEPFYRPREGDLIYLTLSKSYFEITRVETEEPFYQLKNLPVFKMRCELFEYNDEDFDTGITEIDDVEEVHAYQTILTFSTITGAFEIGEEVTQNNTDYTMKGEVVKVDLSNSAAKKVYISHAGATDGDYHEFTLSATITGSNTGATGTPTAIGEDLQDGAMNDDFDNIGDGLVDWSEKNPFGEPAHDEY